MFILTTISDLVELTPEDFTVWSIEAIEHHINAKYANKVVQKIGLCICLYDLLWASEGQVGYGSGIVGVNVECRLLIFRPFKHEVMLGKISSSNPSGIKLRTDFFDEIFVPLNMLPEGSYFDHSQQMWVWNNDGDLFHYDHHEPVRFRVESEEWCDQTPLGPEEQQEGLETKAPYAIEASMADPGLGPSLWWD